MATRATHASRPWGLREKRPVFHAPGNAFRTQPPSSIQSFVPVRRMAKDNPRARRLGEQIQRELGDLLRRDVKDERIGNVTITAVSVTGDLRTARVYYLVFGKDGPDPKVQRGLESAAGFLRNALSRSLMIRYTPTLTFELDTSIEHGVRLTQLIDSVNKPDKQAAGGSEHEHGSADDDGHVIDEG
jgi:ribosome-binding factor A